MLRIRKLRGSKFSEGLHDYLIATGGVVVSPRLISSEHRQAHGQGLLQTGIAELDTMLNGGVTRGTSTLLVGAAGVGKSSLSSRFVCTALEHGESAAIYVFDETVQVYLQRSVGLGIDLQPYLDGKLHLQQLDPAEISPGEFVNNIRQWVAEGAKVIVIDSLNGWLNAMPGRKLSAIADARTVDLPVHARRMHVPDPGPARRDGAHANQCRFELPGGLHYSHALLRGVW